MHLDGRANDLHRQSVDLLIHYSVLRELCVRALCSLWHKIKATHVVTHHSWASFVGVGDREEVGFLERLADQLQADRQAARA